MCLLLLGLMMMLMIVLRKNCDQDIGLLDYTRLNFEYDEFIYLFIPAFYSWFAYLYNSMNQVVKFSFESIDK